jgi:hypothetical protein
VAIILFVPPASIAGLVIWARRLSKTQRVPRFAARVAYGLAAVGGLAIIGGVASAFTSGVSAVTGESMEASDKARRLAEGISEVTNCDALAVLVAGVAASWLLFWSWKTRRSSGGPS